MSSKLARLQARIAELEAERDAALEAVQGVAEAFVIADPDAAKFYLQALQHPAPTTQEPDR